MSGRADPPGPPLADVLTSWDSVIVSWALNGADRSALLGAMKEGEVVDPATYAPASAEVRMRLLVELHDILVSVLENDARVRAWLRTPNRHLCGRTPIDTMARSPVWIRWLIDAVGVVS